AVRLLSDFDDLEASVSQARTTPRGRLRVDVGTTVARLLIIPHLSEFQSRYPEIQIDLGVSDRTVDLISDNVDCVIRGGELSDQSLVARRIGNLEFITVASPDYLQRHGAPQHPRDLESGHRNVIYFSPVSGRRYPLEFHKGGEVIEIASPAHLGINEGNAYISAILAGQGIGQLSRFQIHKYLENGQLQRVLEDWKHPLLPIYVVYPPNSHLSAKVRAFVDWVVELFSRNPLLQGESRPA
ncbi:MAG: LysR substrate-binding domain-containing protein, partial [Comamonas sp.]|nr:LysR substrate-binding domain-containing protein [Comamonas sp.]